MLIRGGSAEETARIVDERTAWDLNVCRKLMVLDNFCLVKPPVAPKQNRR